MSAEVFVTGMLRSGTSLLQTLLTNHPRATVVYQPFHQFHVDVKRAYLRERGLDDAVPLDDGRPGREGERAGFAAWLGERRFRAEESAGLFHDATAGKGGSVPSLPPPTPMEGTFMQLRAALLERLWERFPAGRSAALRGTKEILCEEFVPFLAGQGVRCVLVLRDPRGVVASASHGRYRDSVGDRYPLLMMVRLWRKSAASWLRLRAQPGVCCVRYEDLVGDTAGCLSLLADGLGLEPFPAGFGADGLVDHEGKPWTGNSSYADLRGVASSSAEHWKTLLAPAEQRFIAACCREELAATGYPLPADIGVDDIAGFVEDEAGVRDAYLLRHRLDAAARTGECARFTRAAEFPA